MNIPVMMAFRQFLPHIPEKAIADGEIDFWEACRPTIADPDLPRKVLDGKEDEIIPCIACNVCFSRLYYHQPIMCSVRPTVGHEGEPEWGYYGFNKTTNPRKVVIIGVSCRLKVPQLQPKRVIRFPHEKNTDLGGSVNLASQIDHGSISSFCDLSKLFRKSVKMLAW